METLTALGLGSIALVAWFTWYTARSGAGPLAAIIEAWMNVAVGFSANFAANFALIPLMSPGGHMTPSRNFWGGCIYTAISVLRSFAIRLGLGPRIHRWSLELSAWISARMR